MSIKIKFIFIDERQQAQDAEQALQGLRSFSSFYTLHPPLPPGLGQVRGKMWVLYILKYKYTHFDFFLNHRADWISDILFQNAHRLEQCPSAHVKVETISYLIHVKVSNYGIHLKFPICHLFAFLDIVSVKLFRPPQELNVLVFYVETSFQIYSLSDI